MAVADKAKEKLWAYNPSTGKFACRFPECAYQHDDPGGVNLHHHKKHGPNASRQPAATGTNRSEQRQSEGTKRKPQQTGHTHAWRLLKRSNAVEAAAIHEGYEEVCESCEELR